MKKLVLLFIITFAFGFTAPVFVIAQTASSAEIDELNKQIAAKKETIKQLEETIAKYNKNITQTQTQAQSLKNQLSILDNHLAKAETDIDLTEAKINQAQLQIEALELTIASKEATLEKQKAIIAKMVQSINADKQKNYLEVLLTNNSFASFYDQLQYTLKIYQDVGRSAKVLRLIKEDLQSKRDQVVATRKTYEDLKAELEEKKARLKGQSVAKENLLVTTKSSELKYRTLLSSLKQQYQAVINEQKAYEDQVRKKLEQQNKLGDVVGSFAWPVSSRTITAQFHDPDYPFRNVFEHSAIDIRASQGTPVRAAASGYIARAKTCSLASCYAYVLIVHTGNLSTLYGHLSRIDVAADQFVNKGDIIGLSGGKPGTVGAGPFVTGPHLHFEVRLNGIPVDPLGYL
ncbi:MAG: peptidoglycan DD-metalloendopeptidase family protein [Candidatus Magasanikbacteria bacterium]|nr:peptidoglycan DD-metalloendopeptidase family protein [Candidatus Magasanikbacteria bacterium]